MTNPVTVIAIALVLLPACHSPAPATSAAQEAQAAQRWSPLPSQPTDTSDLYCCDRVEPQANGYIHGFECAQLEGDRGACITRGLALLVCAPGSAKDSDDSVVCRSP